MSALDAFFYALPLIALAAVLAWFAWDAFPKRRVDTPGFDAPETRRPDPEHLARMRRP